jgi:hypothetical protein
VETKEPGQGKRQPLAEGKVVRLPVDWLGPREDLIPFGPSADSQVKDEGESSPPLRAQDFWGEGSAAIHDALEPSAPVASRPLPAPSAPASRRMPRRRLPRARLGIALSLEPLRRAASLCWAEGGVWMNGAHLRRVRLPRGQRRTALAVGGALGAAALLTFVQLDSVAGVTSRPSPNSGSLMTEAFRPATAAAVARVGESVAIRSAQARTTGRVPKVARHAPPQPRSRVIEVKTTTPVANPTVSQTPSTEYTSGTSRLQTASSSGTAGSGESTVSPSISRASATSSSGAGTASTGSGSQSGPAGPGAPFGPGHLG